MKIYCDGVTIDVDAEYRKRGFDSLPPTPTMRAWDIRECAGRPHNYAVWLGGKPLKIEEAIPLTDGMVFDCVPPANY